MAYSYQEFVEWFGEHGGRQRWAKARAPPVASVAIGVLGQIVGKGNSQAVNAISAQLERDGALLDPNTRQVALQTLAVKENTFA